MDLSHEFYETPAPFTRYLFSELTIQGVCCDPGVGAGAIIEASQHERCVGVGARHWVTADIDERWPAMVRGDATQRSTWVQLAAATKDPIDWTVFNPAFTPAVDMINHALAFSRQGVIAHLRASIHEVLKTGLRRTWLAETKPVGILWLPRFAYQRSKSSGDWTTDSVTACWVIWAKDRSILGDQQIRYAPEWVINDLLAETQTYRKRMDELMDRYHTG